MYLAWRGFPRAGFGEIVPLGSRQGTGDHPKSLCYHRWGENPSARTVHFRRNGAGWLRPSMDEKIFSMNRQAAHNYHLLERLEAGLVLHGTEVKSIREGNVNLKDSYAQIQGGEAWLLNCHISPYEFGNRQNHDPLRKRKLLLHQQEIRRLIGKVEERGLTLIPTKLYLKNGRIKCELAIARGKKLYDKRETERRKTAEREARQAMKHHKIR